VDVVDMVIVATEALLAATFACCGSPLGAFTVRGVALVLDVDGDEAANDEDGGSAAVAEVDEHDTDAMPASMFRVVLSTDSTSCSLLGSDSLRGDVGTEGGADSSVRISAARRS
jgi:hypothetical protein